MQAIEFQTIFQTSRLTVPGQYANFEGKPVTVMVLCQEEDEMTVPITSLEEVFGCINYTGPAKSLEEMEQGLLAGVKQQWDADPFWKPGERHHVQSNSI